MMKPGHERIDDRRAMVALIAAAMFLAAILGLVLDRVLEVQL